VKACLIKVLSGSTFYAVRLIIVSRLIGIFTGGAIFAGIFRGVANFIQEFAFGTCLAVIFTVTALFVQKFSFATGLATCSILNADEIVVGSDDALLAVFGLCLSQAIVVSTNIATLTIRAELQAGLVAECPRVALLALPAIIGVEALLVGKRALGATFAVSSELVARLIAEGADATQYALAFGFYAGKIRPLSHGAGFALGGIFQTRDV
jgi:hypothetical protein